MHTHASHSPMHLTALSLQGLSVIAAAGFGASVASSTLHVSLMQAAYHIQLLAMSASLASPGVRQDIYRAAAGYFQW